MTLFDLTGRVCIVSGGSGWLGTAIVETLCAHGASVTALARDLTRAETVLAHVKGDLSVVAGDVTSESWPDDIRSVAADRGRIDVLVNNAHVGRGGSLRTSTKADLAEAMQLAVLGVSEGINAAREGFAAASAKGGSPSVINIASMYGLVAPDPRLYTTEEGRNPPFYGAAKAALIQLTRYAAAELGAEGVRVNAIAPGPFPNEATQRDDAFVARLGHRTMLNRIGRPEEIQSTVVYLASPSSSFTTGAVIPVDGGWTAW